MDANHMDTEITKLCQKYGIAVVLSGPQFPVFPVEIPHGKIHGREADRKTVEPYWPLFWSEWNLYPPELLEKTALKRIILCEALAFENSRFETQLRTALPDFEHHDLHLDVGRGRDDQLYVCKVIHHEFFHIIDFCDDKSLDRDEEWAALNSPGFEYGRGGESQQHDSSTSVLNEDKAGFLNRYSTSGLTEDKAEVFANMVVNWKVVEERSMRDEIIKNKRQTMEALLRRFCPQLDEQFWDKAAHVERALST